MDIRVATLPVMRGEAWSCGSSTRRDVLAGRARMIPGDRKLLANAVSAFTARPGLGPDRRRQDDHPLRRPRRDQLRDRTLIAIEDPVEYQLEGSNRCR